MRDYRSNQNERRHYQGDDISWVVNLFKDKVISARYLFPKSIIGPSDREAGNRQKPYNRQVGVPRFRGDIKQNEENSGCDSRQDSGQGA